MTAAAGRAAGATAGRWILVGGLSTMHDPLLAAVLRRRGLAADPLPAPRDADLATGRAFLAHGYPDPLQYLVGAVVNEVRRRATWGRPAEMTARPLLLTVGGRFSHYGSDYRRALSLAGLGDMAVVALPLTGSLDEPAAGGLPIDARFGRQGMLGCVLGDVLLRLGCAWRPLVAAPEEVDLLIAEHRREIGERLERGRGVLDSLGRLRARLSRLPSGPAPRLRVRLTGDLFSSLTDGEGGAGVGRWLEAHGAVVEPPAVAEWLALLLWQAQDDLRNGQAALVPGSTIWKRLPAAATGLRLRRVVCGLEATYRRCARAAGLRSIDLPDMGRLARLAAPHYATDLRGGPGHLEVGLFLLLEEEDGADLVVSVKPQGSAPSSSLSDAVLHRLAESARTCFATIETSGEGRLQMEGRLELAIELARRRVHLRR